VEGRENDSVPRHVLVDAYIRRRTSVRLHAAVHGESFCADAETERFVS